MKVFRLIFAISLSVIFVVSTLVAMFNAGGIVNAALKTYVFKVEECQFKRIPAPVGEVGESVSTEESEEQCEVDYNSAKRDIAGGFAFLIVSAPLAYFTFKKSQAMFRGERDGQRSNSDA